MEVVNIVLNDAVQGLINEIVTNNWTKTSNPNTSNSVDEALKYIQATWADYLAGGGELNDIGMNKNPSGKAAQSLRHYLTGDFAGEVTTNHPDAEKIQNGTHEVVYDMKKTHPYGNKSRVSKKGIPYLIIPFRWGTPTGKKNSNGEEIGRARWNNYIPVAYYASMVKGMKMSVTTGKTHMEKNFKNKDIPRAEYSWKSRLKESQAWNDRSIGMVRMKNGTKSTYFTFRIISANSPADSWWYRRKAEPGVDMMGALAKTVEENVNKIIERGIMADL